MHKSLAFIFVVPLVVLSACQEPSSTLRPVGLTNSTPAQGGSAIRPADCPPSGATMRTSEGREFYFLGRDPDDAEVCMWTTTSGRGVSRQIRGFWSATVETARFHRCQATPSFTH